MFHIFYPFWGVVSRRRVNLVPVNPSWLEAEVEVFFFNIDNLSLFNDGGNGEGEDVRDGGEEVGVGMRGEGKIWFFNLLLIDTLCQAPVGIG